MLYTLSGVPKEAFEGFPQPRATAIFAPTFHGEGVAVLSVIYGRDPKRLTVSFEKFDETMPLADALAFSEASAVVEDGCVTIPWPSAGIGTLQAVESQHRTADLATVNSALARDQVRAQLGAMGVDATQVDSRVAAMTDAELRNLTGADLGFFPIDDHAAALREDIELLATTPYLEPLNSIAGFIYDVESGEIDDLVRWER